MAEETKETKVIEQEEVLKKEEFTDSISDESLSALITTWMEESNDLYSELKRVWEQNIQYYKGIQTDLAQLLGKQSKAVENRIFMAVETMIPIVTSRLPDIVCRSGSEDEVSEMEAQDLQDVIGYHMERVSIQEKMENWARDMIVKRYGVLKPFWNKENDDLDVKVIDPKRIRIPKYGRTIDELAYIIEELEISYQQAKDFFGEEKAKDLLNSIPEAAVQENKVRKKTISILEVWTNDFVAWKGNNKILKKQSNPYFKEGGENFFDKARKPYIIKSLFHTEESIIGDTDYIQQVKLIQDNINTRKRQVENVVSQVSNPPLLIDSDVMTEEEVSGITNEPGLILYGKDAASGTKIRFEQPGQLPNQVFVDLEGSRTAFDNIWGVHSTTRGEREGRETATGRKLLRSGDLGRIDLVARQVERALDELAEYWTQLIKLFYTEEKTFSILGEDGVRFIKVFSSKNIDKDLKITVTTGSTLPKDEVLIREEARLLWQMKAIGIKTFYKMIRIPNMGEAIKDFQETQSGQILQGGGGGQAPPQLSQGEVAPVLTE